MRKILFVLCLCLFAVSCITYTDEEQAVIDYLAYFNAGTYTQKNYYNSLATTTTADLVALSGLKYEEMYNKAAIPSGTDKADVEYSYIQITKNGSGDICGSGSGGGSGGSGDWEAGDYVSSSMQLKISSTGRIIELDETITILVNETYNSSYTTSSSTTTTLFQATLDEASITSSSQTTSTYRGGYDYKGDYDSSSSDIGITVTLTIDKDNLDDSDNTKTINLKVTGFNNSTQDFTLSLDE